MRPVYHETRWCSGGKSNEAWAQLQMHRESTLAQAVCLVSSVLAQYFTSAWQLKYILAGGNLWNSFSKSILGINARNRKTNWRKYTRFSPKCWSNNVGSEGIRENSHNEGSCTAPQDTLPSLAVESTQRKVMRGILQHHNHSKCKQHFEGKIHISMKNTGCFKRAK